MKAKTWSRGTNSRLPFSVNLNLNLSNTSNIRRKFFTEISVQMVSPLNSTRTENVKEKLTKS